MKTNFILTIYAVAMVSYNAFSQDTPCTATPVTVNGGCFQGNNTGASTLEEPSISCFSANNTVWFSFVATTHSMTVTTDFTSLGELTLTDTQLAVFSSSDSTCTGTLTEIGCDDDGGEGCNFCSTLLMTTLTLGETYFVVVDGQGSSTGTFCLSVFETPTSNVNFGSTCELAHKMYSSNISFDLTAGNNGRHIMNTPSGMDQSCSVENDETENGFWSKFTAVDTDLTIDLIDSIGSEVSNYYDISVYSGVCGSLSEIHSVSVSSINNDYLVSGLTPNEEYYILVTAGSNYSGALAELSISGATASAAPANNICDNAEDISSGSAFEGTNASATADLGLCVGTTENNIWFSWTAPSSWPTDSAAFVYLWDQDCFASGGTQVSIYRADENCATIAGGDNAECIVYNNPSNSNNFYANFIAVANATYLINVDGLGGDVCTFKIRVNNNAPIPLSQFNAKLLAEKEQQSISLKWNVSGDNLFGEYIIERSADGVSFSPLASVSHKKFSVNSYDYRAYHFKDATPLKGKSFYRISKKEGEKNFILTNIASVELNSKTPDIFPNPLNSDDFSIILSRENKGEHLITISDISGKKIYSSNFEGHKGENVVKINIPSLPSGIYIVNVQMEDKVYMSKIVKK